MQIRCAEWNILMHIHAFVIMQIRMHSFCSEGSASGRHTCNMEFCGGYCWGCAAAMFKTFLFGIFGIIGCLPAGLAIS